jgi:hypothetical protein
MKITLISDTGTLVTWDDKNDWCKDGEPELSSLERLIKSVANSFQEYLRLHHSLKLVNNRPAKDEEIALWQAYAGTWKVIKIFNEMDCWERDHK